MSESVTQELGFDASQALASLTQLDGALARFEANLQRSAAAMKAFNDAGSRTPALLSRLSTSAAKVNSAFESLNTSTAASAFTSLGTASTAASGKVAAASRQIAASNAASAASIGRLTTSAQLLSRIAFTQFAIRGLNTLRLGLESTAAEAVDFERAVAQIRTIDNSGASFEHVAKSVRDLSDAYNLPLLQTAKGLYQSIGNQVGDFAQSLEFATEAAKFAKATDSSLADSVDLLSAALKSYGLTVNDTGKVSSTFFKTIDLGRVEAKELANSMGRVLPIASQLGVSLDEAGASLAAISVKGSGTSESITQLRAIMTAFLKPSDAMKDALKELGVSSSELLIHEVGLAGALRLMADRTGGSQTALASLFQNVRGLAGATSLTSDGLREMANDIDQMTAAGRNFANEKFLQATSTNAERVTAELNKLKNAFTTELGRSILESAANFSKLTGGADNMIASAKVLTPAVLDLGAGLVTLRASSTAAAAGLGRLVPVLNAIALTELAKSGGKILGGLFEESRSAANLSPLQQLEKANAQGLDAFKAQLNEAADAGNKANQDRLTAALQYTRSLNQVYLKQQANLEASQKTLQKLQSKSKLSVPEALQLQQAEQTQSAARAQNPLGNLQLGEIETILNRKINTPDELSRGLIEIEKRAEAARAQIVQLGSQTQIVDNLRNEVDSLFSQIDQKANVRSTSSGQFSEALRAQFQALDAQFKQALADGKVTEQELSQLIEKRNEFGKNALEGQNPLVGRLQFGSTIELLDQALAKMQQLSELPAANIGPLQQQLQTLDGALQRFTSQLETGVSASATIADNFRRAATASAQIKVPAGQPQGLAKGGLVHYYADGGFTPRGTDTIPAMLSPGEFVVNAAATRKFYAQLVAINSGRQPIYRADGGPTNNVTFTGDISIVENNSGRDTARELAGQLRRELRRSTGRI